MSFYLLGLARANPCFRSASYILLIHHGQKVLMSYRQWQFFKRRQKWVRCSSKCWPLTLDQNFIFTTWWILDQSINFHWPSLYQSVGIRASLEHKSCSSLFKALCFRVKMLTSKSYFNYMVLIIWTNFIVLYCSSIHCYHQNLADVVLKLNVVEQSS
jgi:hypothetical protein